MGSLSEVIAEAGGDLRRFSQASVSVDGNIPPIISSVDGPDNSSMGAEIDNSAAETLPPRHKPPVSAVQDKIETPKTISRAYSLFSGLSSKVGALRATFLLGDYERVHVEPEKERNYSIEDIEANTFRGSVKVKPSSSVRVPAQGTSGKSSDKTQQTTSDGASITTTTAAATTCSSAASLGNMLTPIHAALPLTATSSALTLQNPLDNRLGSDDDSSIA